MVLRCIQIAGCSAACSFCCPVVSQDMEAGGHLGCFWFLAIINEGTKNIHVQVISLEKPGGVGLLSLMADGS